VGRLHPGRLGVTGTARSARGQCTATRTATRQCLSGFEEGEWISQVDGWYGKYIDYLKFTTNKGNYKEWGTPGGGGNTAFSVEGRINGFYGFAEGSLDGIGFFHPY
jgi:hypothetical protein